LTPLTHVTGKQLFATCYLRKQEKLTVLDAALRLVVPPADDEDEAQQIAMIAAKLTERGRTPEQRAELRRLFSYDRSARSLP
jgi:hypothetical protein